jgi:hypothetical protein
MSSHCRVQNTTRMITLQLLTTFFNTTAKNCDRLLDKRNQLWLASLYKANKKSYIHILYALGIWVTEQHVLHWHLPKLIITISNYIKRLQGKVVLIPQNKLLHASSITFYSAELYYMKTRGIPEWLTIICQLIIIVCNITYISNNDQWVVYQIMAILKISKQFCFNACHVQSNQQKEISIISGTGAVIRSKSNFGPTGYSHPRSSPLLRVSTVHSASTIF